MHKYDYIIAGSGLAGLYTAWLAAKNGKVAILTKSAITESNSYYAQGGIAAVVDENDTPSLHFEDTIVAGRGLCDYPAVNILVNEGPQRIEEIISAGMHFDMAAGSLALGLEGGHHRKRILHAGGDATGRMITSFMIDKIKDNPNIEVFEDHAVIGLLNQDGKCYGVSSWDTKKNKEEIFYAHNTFLTLGGTSAIYRRTTNPSTTIGDGLALAFNAGCKIGDMEFIQFHPSAIYTNSDEAFLISEAVRGEGAYLLNEKGERFMLGAHELAELAPRDVVAQAIYREIQHQEQDFVWLSLKHLDSNMIKKRFPTIYQKCKDLGIDMTDRIPVSPAAHYTVGGVRTDENGQSNIENLFVCGELASSGIMGANRLASNSLIECLVFGKRAVDYAEKQKKEQNFPKFEKTYHINKNNAETYYVLKSTTANLMMKRAGIIRNAQLLSEGLYKIDKLREDMPNEDNEYYSLLCHNLLTVAHLILSSALYREESRGGHYREDFPQDDDKFLFHIIQEKGKDIATQTVDCNL
ncbi:MAG: L-aspartate oxidase [Culturomica sp.]|jgi:L-aspartate oxidase|nr:L-aspartate oxidase [Culturomica sp.]